MFSLGSIMAQVFLPRSVPAFVFLVNHSPAVERNIIKEEKLNIMSIMKSDTNTGRPDGSVTAGQLGNLHGSGSPVCDLTSAVVAAGTSAATSAPVLAVSHRGETMHVPALHYGSDGSGSGSSFLTPARRARSR